MKRVFHLDLAYARGWSGGDNCTFETLRYFVHKGVQNIHITTENCRAMYERKGLHAGPFYDPRTVPDYCRRADGLPLLIAFFRRIRAALKLIRAIELKADDTVILHNDFFVNSIPGWMLSAKNPAARVLYWIHMLSPDLFRGFEGQYTNRLRIPSPALFQYWFSQRLQARLMRSNGQVISHNPMYAELLPEKFPRCCGHRLIYPYSGVPGEWIPDGPAAQHEWDAVWLGRFHPQKGLYDLLKVAAELKARRPDVR